MNIESDYFVANVDDPTPQQLEEKFAATFTHAFGMNAAGLSD